MKSVRVAFGLIVALVAPGVADAHRLDEYLQASRLSVAPGRILVEVDLTAGVSVAAGISARIDTNHDGVISKEESVAYARDVLADVSLIVNDAEVPLTMTSVVAPSIADMLEGVGTMRIAADAEIREAGARPLRIRYRNDHRADLGVYLVNAMRPPEAGVTLIGQERDHQQREIRLEYNLAPNRGGSLGWLAVSAAVFAGLFGFRLKKSRSLT